MSMHTVCVCMNLQYLYPDVSVFFRACAFFSMYVKFVHSTILKIACRGSSPTISSSTSILPYSAVNLVHI